jgi:hypothetical protein
LPAIGVAVGNLSDDHCEVALFSALCEERCLGQRRNLGYFFFQGVDVFNFWAAVDTGDRFGQEHGLHVGDVGAHFVVVSSLKY